MPAHRGGHTLIHHSRVRGAVGGYTYCICKKFEHALCLKSVNPDNDGDLELYLQLQFSSGQKLDTLESSHKGIAR